MAVTTAGYYASDGSGLGADATPTDGSGTSPDTLGGDSPSGDMSDQGGETTGSGDASAADTMLQDGDGDGTAWDIAGGEVDTWNPGDTWVDSSSDTWMYDMDGDVPPWTDTGDHSCCVSGGPSCADPGVASCVCAQDPYCCGTAWDETCVQEVMSLGCAECLNQDGWSYDTDGIDGGEYDVPPYTDVGYDTYPDGAGVCQPICGYIGSKSEGWFDSCSMTPLYSATGIPLWDQCKSCTALCEGVGTSAEGWYSSCSGKLIALAICM